MSAKRLLDRLQRLLVAIAAFALCATGLSVTSLSQPTEAHALGENTNSAVTKKASQNTLDNGNGPFKDLEVTVSQTKDLLAQAVTVSYKGGPNGSGRALTDSGNNFLQMAQCWGEDPEHPGHPDRRTCVMGSGDKPAGMRSTYVRSHAAADKSPVDPHDEKYTATRTDAGTVYDQTEIPFVAENKAGEVDETKAPADTVISNIKTDKDGQRYFATGAEYVSNSNNQYYSKYSSNEINWAPFSQDGRGSVPFEVQTPEQSSALPCGRPTSTGAGTSCWLVVIPRPTSDNGSPIIETPPLLWDSWQHHIAFKLDFKPLGQRCNTGKAERHLAGSELPTSAVASWQPVLCSAGGGSPFAMVQMAETDAVRAASGTSPSPLALTLRAADKAMVGDGQDPLAYAPIALGGVVVSYSVDVNPSYSSIVDQSRTPAELEARRGQPMPAPKLTPRLLAKLLTHSYANSVPQLANEKDLNPKGEADDYLVKHPAGKRPWELMFDQDFLSINDPAWKYQGGTLNLAIVPIGRSDMTTAVWEYIMADPDARDFMAGKPDPWGMTINPWFSTDPSVNLSGAGAAIPSDSYPQSDPNKGKGDSTMNPPAPEVDLITAHAFSLSYGQGPKLALRGETLANGGWDKDATPPAYKRADRQILTMHSVMAMGTSDGAERYQTATALLRNPAGEFVAPDVKGLSAAASAMTANKDQAQVMQYDFGSDQAKSAKDAYPLALPVYAALNPEQTDKDMRAEYANFIEYAATKGQVPGTSDGQLPPGYAPLPAKWVEQAKIAAKAIRDGHLPETVAPPEGDSSISANGAAGGPTGTSPAGTLGSSDSGMDGGDYGSSDSADAGSTSTDDSSAPDDSSSGDGATDAEHQQPGAGDPAAKGAGAAGKASTTPDDPSRNPWGAVLPVTGVLALAAGAGIPFVGRLRRTT